jgi:hypothetical protein
MRRGLAAANRVIAQYQGLRVFRFPGWVFRAEKRAAGLRWPPGAFADRNEADGDEDGANKQGVEQHADGDGDTDLGDVDVGELGEG